jgi:hypothetical protein
MIDLELTEKQKKWIEERISTWKSMLEPNMKLSATILSEIKILREFLNLTNPFKGKRTCLNCIHRGVCRMFDDILKKSQSFVSNNNVGIFARVCEHFKPVA